MFPVSNISKYTSYNKYKIYLLQKKQNIHVIKVIAKHAYILTNNISETII